MPPAETILEARGLTKTFGTRTAVDDVSFRIGAGETYGLLGPNGAGKTTTISMVCGLMDRDAGEVTVAGSAMGPRAFEAKRAIGLVPQDLALYPDLSGRENLAFFGRLYGLRRAELRRRIDDVLGVVQLADRAEEKTEKYSGGMKRRLNIAIGLLHQPQLLILDEPTVGVDPQSRNAILASVERLGAGGLAVLYTTHYMEEAERLCDRVGIIDAGYLIAEGTRADLVALVGAEDRVQLGVAGAVEAAAMAIGEVAGVQQATTSEGTIHLIVKEARRLLPDILARAAAARATVNRVDVAEPDLEAVFLHLTGKALRD